MGLKIVNTPIRFRKAVDPTSETNQLLKLSKPQLIERLYSERATAERHAREFQERMDRADKNFAIVCRERDHAKLEIAAVNPKLESERDLYKKLYEDILAKVLDR